MLMPCNVQYTAMSVCFRVPRVVCYVSLLDRSNRGDTFTMLIKAQKLGGDIVTVGELIRHLCFYIKL